MNFQFDHNVAGFFLFLFIIIGTMAILLYDYYKDEKKKHNKIKP